MSNQPASKEEVLMAFAVEADGGPETLRQYLQEYPQFALELIDLSRERSRTFPGRAEVMDPADQTLIDRSWAIFLRSAAATAGVENPFAGVDVARLREIAASLGVPRQIITSFKERVVVTATVPVAFLRKLASLLDAEVEAFSSWLSQPPALAEDRSYRADLAPEAAQRRSFGKLLEEAGMTEEERARILGGGGEEDGRG